MSTATPDFADVIKRLERLERQRVILLFVFVLALAAAGTCLYLGQRERSTSHAATVEVERIVFRDSAGNPHYSIRWDASSESLAFSDAAGTMRAKLGSTPSGGPSWNLLARDGSPRVLMGVGQDEAGVLGLPAGNGQASVSMFSIRKKPMIAFLNEQNNLAATLGHDGLYLYGKDGRTKIGALATDDGGQVLGFSFPTRMVTVVCTWV